MKDNAEILKFQKETYQEVFSSLTTDFQGSYRITSKANKHIVLVNFLLFQIKNTRQSSVW